MIKSGKISSLYLLGLLFSILFYVRCNKGVNETMIPIEPIATGYDGLEYAGSQNCIPCHEDIYNDHLKTAHFNTSQLATKDKILGDFTDSNILKLNDHIFYKMTDEDKLYQSAFQDEKLVRKEPFDIIIGSGTKGQTYLYWNMKRLYQLPISYWKESKNWIHSPGYLNNRINFDRSVIPNCLECHATFAKNHIPNDFTSNVYKKKEIILGVDCESCHGPSAKHVNAHISNPKLKDAQHILDIKTLSQQQKLDACAKCHSGLRKPLRMPFTFKTGDKLNDFLKPSYTQAEVATLDVHGNQYGLLTASQCFKKSEAMNCSTCHNPHKNERGSLEQFSQKCIGCHQDSADHKFNLTDEMRNNCINCHMPLLSSSAVTFEELDEKDKTISDSLKVRTHKIGIYDDVSKKIHEYIKKVSLD